MVIRAVTDIGEDVLFGRKGRMTDPSRAFGAHVGKGRGLAVHPQRHVMAADAGQGPTAGRHPGGGVMRTA